MTTLRHCDRKAKQWISPNGRLIAVPLTGPVRPEVPEWLVERVRTYAKRFDWGPPVEDPWEILRRLNHAVPWHEWGAALHTSGVALFVSEAIPCEDQRMVVHLAEQLNVACAFSPWGSRFVFAPKGTWR